MPGNRITTHTEPTESSELPQSPGMPHERYFLKPRRLLREVSAGSFISTSSLTLPHGGVASKTNEDLRKIWWQNRLLGTLPVTDFQAKRREISIVDLFAGCGGLATGIKWACEAVGVRPVVEACVEVVPRTLQVYKTNVRPLRTLRENVANLVDYECASDLFKHRRPRIIHQELEKLVGKVDLLIAGPPCEGHSNFNNKTRRTDPRNELYVAVAACAIALKATVVVIENVDMVKRAHQNVVERVAALLQASGYKIDCNDTVLEASWFGTPQRRRRHFFIASKRHHFDADNAFEGIKCPPISVMDSIGDLVGVDVASRFDSPAKLSLENQRRTQFLIENDIYDLPDSERPACHREGGHSYKSVYGRMRPDEPASTLTKGFLSPGRGRFTHPTEARGLTPHEGARLQGFPDDFTFTGKKVGQLYNRDFSRLIGDAVPPQLGYAVGLSALSIL